MSSATQERIVILHLSDLHAGQRFRKGFHHDLPLDKRCQRLLNVFKDTFGKLNLPRVDLLVLSGDLTDGGQQEEFEAFITHFLKPLTENGVAQCAIAAPGNHDVDWKIVRKPREGIIPLHEFKTRISGARFEKLAGQKIYCPPLGSGDALDVLALGDPTWCQVVPFNSVNLGGTPHPDIGRYLKLDPKKPLKDGTPGFEENEEMFDDTKNRIHEIPPIDPAFVSDDDLSSVHSTLDDNSPEAQTPFRIAVIHHNPIPYANEGSNPRPYRFLNDGAFNDFLIKNRFHLVLHGHQHVSELFAFSTLSSTSASGLCGAGSGFLCLGAPSFGAEDASGLGFNLITIKRSPSVATLQIERFTWAHSSGGGVQKLTKNESFHVIPLEDLDERRGKLLNQLSIMVFKQEKLTELERNTGIRDASTEADFFERLRQLRRDHKNIRAMYSLSVFGPELWNDKRLAEYFLPEARRNIARAAALAKSLEARYQQKIGEVELKGKFQEILKSGIPNLLFCFSSPLYSAVRCAKNISKDLGITSALRAALTTRQLQDLQARDRDFIKRTLRDVSGNVSCTDKSDSLSIWDNVCSVPGTAFAIGVGDDDTEPIDIAVATSLLSRISLEDMRLDLDRPYKFVPQKVNDEVAVSKLAEFPRILLWRAEDFDSAAAIETIEFHENCAFPLFWIRPEALVNAGRQKKLRQHIGHFTIIDANKKEVSSRWNDDRGNTPPEPKSAFDPSWVGSLWHDAPPRALEGNPHFIDEFVHLLRRPDIMFAADAWAMRKMGTDTWKKLIEHLGSIDVSAWMDHPAELLRGVD